VGGELDYAVLRHCARGELSGVVGAVADSRETVRYADLAGQVDDRAGKDFARVLGARVRYIRTHELGGSQVSFRFGRRREPENGRGVEYHRHAVGDDRVVVRVAVRDVLADHAGDRVRHAVRKVDARVSESNAREGCREQHVGPDLLVIRVLDCLDYVARHHNHGSDRPDVADRV